MNNNIKKSSETTYRNKIAQEHVQWGNEENFYISFLYTQHSGGKKKISWKMYTKYVAAYFVNDRREEKKRKKKRVKRKINKSRYDQFMAEVKL